MTYEERYKNFFDVQKLHVQATLTTFYRVARLFFYLPVSIKKVIWRRLSQAYEHLERMSLRWQRISSSSVAAVVYERQWLPIGWPLCPFAYFTIKKVVQDIGILQEPLIGWLDMVFNPVSFPFICSCPMACPLIIRRDWS